MNLILLGKVARDVQVIIVGTMTYLYLLWLARFRLVFRKSSISAINS